MPLKLPPIPKPGTTKRRKQFWDEAREAVIESQKLAGRYVTVSEYPGKGTVINVADTSARRRPASGVPCPVEDPETISVAFSGIGSCCINTATRSFDLTTPSDFNTSFVLNFGGPHEWNLGLPAFQTVERYDDFDCSGDHEPVFVDAFIEVFCDHDGWTARIALSGAGISSSNIFFGTSSGLSVSNSLACAGSATITL